MSKHKKNKNMTRQGVRDLNSLPGFSNGRKLAPIPEDQLCQHHRVNRDRHGNSVCAECKQAWDSDGFEI